jgi:porin
MMRRLMMTTVCFAALSATARAEDAQPAEETPAANLQLAFTGDIWSNTSGGLDEGTVFVDIVNAQLSLDLEKLTGWQGAQAFVYGLYTNGNSISSLTGDFNGISNIETGLEAARLVEAWVDQSFAGGQGSLRVGLYDLATEFDAGEVRALFLNAGHGSGTDFSQTGLNGPSLWPVTSFAARVNYNFDGGVYLRGTIADGVPGDPAHPKRTTIDFRSGDGVLLAAETGVAREGRHWAVGLWTYSEDFPDLVTTQTHSNFGGYASMEEQLLSSEAGDAFNLSGSVRAGFASDDVNPLSSFLSATVVATGLIPSLPEDQIGLGIMVANAGDKFLSVSGIAEPKDQEINLELTYFANLTSHLSIQPDIQYIINPGMDGAVDNALVFGVRLQLVKDFNLD